MAPDEHAGAPPLARPEPAHIAAYGPELLRHATRLMGNGNDAKDLVQDTFERAVRGLERFQPGTNLRAWLYTIMVRRARDHFRREKVRPVEEVDEESLPAPAPEEPPPAWAAVTPEQLRRAVAQLQSPFRETFELREIHQLPYHEVAERLRVPTNTVATRLRRARQRLKELLAAELGTPETR